MRFRRRASNSKSESEKALKEAQEILAKVQERGPEVTEVANTSRNARARNHFIDQFEEIFIVKKVRSDDS